MASNVTIVVLTYFFPIICLHVYSSLFYIDFRSGCTHESMGNFSPPNALSYDILLLVNTILGLTGVHCEYLGVELDWVAFAIFTSLIGLGGGVTGFNRRSRRRKLPQLHNLPAMGIPTGPRTLKKVSSPLPLTQTVWGKLSQVGIPRRDWNCFSHPYPHHHFSPQVFLKKV